MHIKGSFPIVSSSYSTHCPSSQWNFISVILLSQALLCTHSHVILPYSLATYLHQLPHLSLPQSPQNLLLYYYQGPIYLYSFTSVSLLPPHSDLKLTSYIWRLFLWGTQAQASGSFNPDTSAVSILYTSSIDLSPWP